MRIAQVVGKLTLNRCIPEFDQASLKLVHPLDQSALNQLDGEQGGIMPSDETLVAWDTVGVGQQANVAISEGPEASMPFRPDIKPIDTSIVALLDTISVSEQQPTSGSN